MALYLGHLAVAGLSMASIEQARAAVSHFHAVAGIQKADNLARHPAVAEAIKGWRNRAPAPRQADALTCDALARVHEVLRLPRRSRGGRLESQEATQHAPPRTWPSSESWPTADSGAPRPRPSLGVTWNCGRTAPAG